MADYRFLAVDLLSHTQLADLPLSGAQYGQVLNQAGECGGTLTLPSDFTHAKILVDATIPLRRAVYVERDGVLVWGGPIWARNMTDPQTVTIKALEWWSLFARRLISTTKTYTNIDQLFIARQLVDYAQSKYGGALGIDVDSTVSAVYRDRTYESSDFKPVGEAVSQLAAVDDGFDFAIDVAWDYSTSPPSIQRTFRTYYPQRGRTGAATGLVWELGRNVSKIGWPEDGTNASNSVRILGATVNDQLMTSSSVVGLRTDILNQGYPLLEQSLSMTDINVQATLDAHAIAEVNARAVPVVLPPVTVNGNLDPQIGSYITGDECRLRIQPNSDPRFPDGVDETRRITAWKVDAQTDEVTLSLDVVAS